MNDDDKNNAVQDNQVSSTGQNNSPPSEFFKEDVDLEDDFGKYDFKIIKILFCVYFLSKGLFTTDFWFLPKKTIIDEIQGRR